MVITIDYLNGWKNKHILALGINMNNTIATKKVIREQGLNHPSDSKIHKQRSPSSEWIEVRFHNSKDVEEAVRLFKLALESY